MSTTRTEDWHGKMTAKAAWRFGHITKEEFQEIKKRHKDLEKEQSSTRAMNSKPAVKAQITIEDAETAQLREDLRVFRASLRGEVTQ